MDEPGQENLEDHDASECEPIGPAQGIVIRCEAGHEQRILTPDFTREMAQELGTMMDGTNPIYVYPPREFPMEGSKLGKCQRCGAWYKSTLFGYDAPPDRRNKSQASAPPATDLFGGVGTAKPGHAS